MSKTRQLTYRSHIFVSVSDQAEELEVSVSICQGPDSQHRRSRPRRRRSRQGPHSKMSGNENVITNIFEF